MINGSKFPQDDGREIANLGPQKKFNYYIYLMFIHIILYTYLKSKMGLSKNKMTKKLDKADKTATMFLKH